MSARRGLSGRKKESTPVSDKTAAQSGGGRGTTATSGSAAVRQQWTEGVGGTPGREGIARRQTISRDEKPAQAPVASAALATSFLEAVSASGEWRHDETGGSGGRALSETAPTDWREERWSHWSSPEEVIARR
jgi:hypothetical protein